MSQGIGELRSVGERRRVIGEDFVKKVRVERWIEIKGSRENELRDAELLVVVAVCQRSPQSNKELSVETSESRVTG